mgnify:CR=1 FL=1
MVQKMAKKVIWMCNVVKRYLLRDTNYFFLSIYRYFQNNYHNNCKFYTEKELTNLIRSGKSIIRIGDGEIGLVHFCNAAYQVYSDAIRNDFLKIIKNYNNDSLYVIGITEFVNYTNTELKNFVNTEGNKINRFPVWRQLKITYEMIFNREAKYFDALAFYKKGGFERIVLPCIKNKKVIIITNKENKEAIIASPLSSNTYLYVTCKNENAYENRMKIEQDIINLIHTSGLPKSDFVILFAAGLAKTIIHDMSGQGYQVLDIGWGLKSYYTGIIIENLI